MADAAPIRAALMITCLGDMLYPDVGVAIVRLLRKLGVVVEFPAGQTCCGLPLFNSGYHREAAGVARRLVEIFRDAPYVVVPSGSCAWMVKHEVPGLLKDTPVAEDARRLAAKTYEFSQFLVRVLGKTKFTSRVRGRVTYHDSCQLNVRISARRRTFAAAFTGYFSDVGGSCLAGGRVFCVAENQTVSIRIQG